MEHDQSQPNYKAYIQPILIAIQFLSCIPVGKQALPKEQDIGASLSWYPLVGLLLGCILAFVAFGASYFFEPLLSAAITLSFWVFLTGALHIDGLADCADAWLGGLGSKEKTLHLMKDPTSGPIAITTVVLLLLLKFVALEALIRTGNLSLLIWPLVFARMSAGFLFISTPYARESGLGSAIAQHKKSNQILLIAAITTLLSSYFLTWMIAPLLITLGLIFWYLRTRMLRRLDGCTGDTAGALVEIAECLALLSLVACLGVN